MEDSVAVFNQSRSQHFSGEKKILLVDFASAEKITATIREEKNDFFF